MMLRILLCCGGGFSSSAITVRMQNEIKDRGLEDQYSIDFFCFEMAGKAAAEEKLKDYDIAILCPHLKMVIKRFLDEGVDINIPVYLLPPRIYGNMQLDVIIKDCEDILEMYKNGAVNPVSFPGEDNLLKIRRLCAHRDL